MSALGHVGPAVVAARGRAGAGAPSLSQAIGALCQDAVRLRSELKRAQLEISRLRDQLAQRPARGAAPRSLEKRRIQLLRRQISFHCHPDRGGDGELMQRINELFDELETLSCSPAR